MDLMTLVAHVTLDTSEYEQALSEAQKEAEKLSIQENYSLGLDNSDFMTNIGEAAKEAEDFEGPEDQSVALDTTEFSQGIEGAEGEAEAFQSNLDAVWEGIKTGLKVAGVGAAIAAVFNQLADCVNLASKLGDNVDKGSKRLNISTDAYQEWSHALQQNGADINDLQRGILSINKLLGGGEVPKAAAEAFEKLGVSTTKANGGLKSTEEYLSETIQALADFKGTAEERGTLVEAIFGRNGNQLNAMFDSGSDGIKGLIKEAHELGLVMSESEIANSVAYGDAVANMNSAIESLKTSFATGIIPVLTDAVNMITKIVAFFNGRTGSDSLADSFENTNKALGKDIVQIESTSQAAMTLIDKLFAMGEAEKLTAEQQAEWKATAQWLIDNIPSLSEKINIDTSSINGNTEELKANVAAWREYAIQRAKAAALEKQQNALAEKTTEWLEAAAEAKRIEAEYTKKQAEVETLLRRDYSNMPENQQARFREKFGYGSAEDMDWTAGSKLYGQLENALGNWYQEWGFSSYGSKDLVQAIDERSVMQDSIAAQLQEANEKAEKLREEVDAGQQQLQEYDAILTDVVNSILPAATSAEGEVEKVGEQLDNLPEKKTITIDILAKYPNLNLPGLDFHPHATGAWDIPYDDYPALLHKDEMVLTAAQAKEYRHNRGGISNQQMSDIIGSIQSLGDEISRMKLYVGRDAFARVVTDIAGRGVHRYINGKEHSEMAGFGAV